MNKIYTCVCVTALYNIQRENNSVGGDGRKWSDYLLWFAKTLQLHVPMVIFVESELVEFVKTHRPTDVPTHTVVQPLTEIPYYGHLAKMKLAISEQNKRKDSTSVESTLPLYNIIQYSKFKWLQHAQKIYDSSVWLWIDAGISRFMNVQPNLKWPHLSWIDNISKSKRVWIQTKTSKEQLIHQTKNIHLDSYIGSHECFLVGTLFGGPTKSVNRLSTLVDGFLQNELLDKKRMDNEQIAMMVLMCQRLFVQKKKNIFRVVAARYSLPSQIKWFFSHVVGTKTKYWLPWANEMYLNFSEHKFEIL